MAVNDDLNAALTKMDLKHQIYKYLVSIGASFEGAALISESPQQMKLFDFDGYSLKLRGREIPIIEDDEARDIFLKGPFKTLFKIPEADNKATEVDPAILAAAQRGNLTARGQIFKTVGGNQEKFEELLLGGKAAAAAVDKPAAAAVAHDKNPWAPLPANIDANGRYIPNALTRQAALVKATGAAAAAGIAAAVGSRIGDTTAPGFAPQRKFA